MLNSTIAANINTLSLGKQIASGSRSSLLTSHIEFTSSESKFAVAPNSYQSKCLRTSNSKNGKMLDSDVVFNGQKKENGGVDQNKNLKVMKHHAVMNGNHESRPQGDGVPNPRICLYPQGKIHLEWRQIHKIGAGLANLGNTCFMNTVVQCLTYCPPLVNYLLHDNDHTAKCKITGFCMMCELQKHMKRALDHPGDVIKPLYIYQKLKSIAKHFQFGRQEDAHEFLRYVIDNLWKASLYNYDGNVKLDPASKETTVINHIFGGYHRSQVVCLRCREKSNTYDHFMDFILDIKQNVQNLEKALEKFVQPELLQNDNAYKCPKCNMKVSAQKRFTVHRPPNVATFQFKRFDYNRVFGGKITKHVSYPEKLDIRPYMSDTKGAAVLYRLNAVLVHLGPSCNSGHYFCYVRNSNGCWYLMDDARVHQVSLNQVLNQQAYVLFYIRVPSQSSNQLKKSMSAINHKTMDGLKNGTMVNATSDLPGTPVLRTSAVTKTTSSPAIIRVSSATSSPMVNGNVHNSSSKLSLSQNREKVVFGIRRPEPGVKSLYSKGSSTVAKSTPSSTSNASGKKACLVPYDGDSSESDEGSRKPEAAGLKSKGKMDTCKEENSLVKNTSAEACSSTESRKQNDKIQKCDENAISADQKAIKVSNSEKQSVHRTLSPSVNTTATSASMTKVKSSFTWNVSDASLYSPSVASGSSTNSVNSTADWNVDVLAEKEANNRNKGERLYTGWTVTQNDKITSDHSNKERGLSVVPKDTCATSSTNTDKHVKSEDVNKKENAKETAQLQTNVSINSKLEGNCEDSSAKVEETNGVSSGRENDCKKQEMEEKSSDSSTVSEQKDLKSNSKDEQSFLGKFRDHSESGDSSFLKSSKKHKSSETEKRKRETNSSKGTASDNSISNVHKSSGTKRESELPSNNEAGNHPVPKKCKETHDEHEKRKSECRHTERLSKDWKNRKKYNKHDKNSWRNHKINKRYAHRKYGLTQSHTNSSYNSQDRNYYVHERSYFNEETDFVEPHNNSYYPTDSDNQWNSAKKARREHKNNSSGQAQVSQYKNEDKHSSGFRSNYKTGESDNSSCSYEMEWVEKTKETVEAERKLSPDSYSAPHSWNSDIKDGFSRHRSGKNYRYDNMHWNGKNKTDTIRELQSYSSKGYGIGVNSWDGSESQLEREAQEDFLLSRVDYDLYDEEYDRGKVKKVKNWAINGRRMQPSYNPFQKVWDNRSRKYQEQTYRRSKSFHRRKDFSDNNFRRWNYLKWVEPKNKSARI